jgi:uncharacterized membrane protein/membrane protease YdiL (CAAX protease family)
MSRLAESISRPVGIYPVRSGVMSSLAEFIKRHPVAAFVVLTCALSWVFWVPVALIGAGDQALRAVVALAGFFGPAVAGVLLARVTEPALKGQSRRWIRWATFFVAWVTSIAVVILYLVMNTAARLDPSLVVVAAVLALPAASVISSAVARWTGQGNILSSWFRQRGTVLWCLVAILLPPAVRLLEVAILWALGQQLPSLRQANPAYPSAGFVAVAFLWYVLFQGGLAEGLGWRGFALCRLQSRHSPLVAAIVLGCFWVVWSIPAVLSGVIGPARGDMVFYLMLGFVLGVAQTWISNRTKGSTLAATLMWASWSLLLFNLPLSDVFAVLLAGSAVLLIVVDQMWRRLPVDEPLAAPMAALQPGRADVVEKAETVTSRLLSLDALRGLIIVFMALDHAILFVGQAHFSAEYWGGTFSVWHSAFAFLSRLVTHFCAPGFFFLMGVGMWLLASARQKQGWSKWAIIRHFLVRGAVLIGLQFLVEDRAWALNVGGWGLDIYVGVLFGLGGAMILGSLLLWLRPRVLLPLTVALWVGMQLLVPNVSQWPMAAGGNPLRILNLLFVMPGGDSALFSNYPILPWLPLVMFGIVFGYWVADNPHQAFRRALWLGVAFLAAFAVIRYLDGFGNIRWRLGNTWIDFLDMVKYPPSMTFTLMTMGVNLILVSLFARAGAKAQEYLRPLTVFGRAPLFFYVAHLFVYAGIGTALGQGVGTAYTYPFWLMGLLLLYPVCQWYGSLKQRQPARTVLQFL